MIMNKFFRIDHASYNRFRRVWEDMSFVGYDESTCPACGRIINTMIYKDEKYQFLLWGGKSYPDWIRDSGVGEKTMLLSEKTVEILQKEGITGFSVKCEASLYDQDRKKNIEKITDCPRYYVIDIYGRIDYDYASMFLKRKKQCTHCNQFSLNRERLYPEYLDESLWDGSDLCFLLTSPRIWYCTERFVQVVKKHKLTGFDFYETREKMTD